MIGIVIAVFLLGIAAGAFVWMPIAIRRCEREQQELHRRRERYRGFEGVG